MRKIIIPFIFAIILVASSCTTSNAGVGYFSTDKNSEIDLKLREQIHQLNMQVIQGITNNKPSIIVDLSGNILKTHKNDIAKVTKELQPLIKESKLSVIDEYHSTLHQSGSYNLSIPSEVKQTKNTYFLNSINLSYGKTIDSSDYYVSMLEMNEQVNSYMLICVYAKESGKWRLTGLNCGIYKIRGMTAIDMYLQAKNLSSRGYIIPASLYLNMANELLKPCGFFQYEKENEIKEYSKSLYTKIKNQYKFPVTLKTVDTSPSIYGIKVDNVTEGFVAIINYKSKTSLNDAKALKKEAEAMTKEIDKEFPGLSSSFPYLCYKAFAEFPSDPNKTYKSYGTVIKTTSK